jgi:hypothetical protein
MARDFEDLHDLDDLNDRELRDLVRQRLSEDNTLDIDDVTVQVENGTVILSGRVGTDEERRVAEHVVTDGLGVQNYRNELLVDATRRAESPEAIDEHLVDEDRREGLLLGDRAVPLSPEAEHLDTDDDDDLYGTTDVQHSIEEANPWIPPSSPTPEGLGDTPGMGEAH